MKKMLVLGLLAMTLTACGGGMDSVIAEAGGEEVEAPTTQLPASALVDSVQWRDTTVQFINANMDEQEPVILTIRQGNMVDGDPLALLEGQADMLITPAELWMALTQREDVPSALALDHLRVSGEEGRILDYQHYDLNTVTTRKQGIPADRLHSLFPVIDSNHCWTSVKGVGVSVGPFFGHTQSYACTSHNPTDQSSSSFVRFAPVTLASACPTSFNTTAKIRAGVASAGIPGQATTDIEQLCFDSGGGLGWQCLDSVLFLQGTQFVSDFQADAAHPHRIGIGVTSSHDTIMDYGAARALSKPPLSSTNGFCN